MSYGKSGRGLEGGGARNISAKMPVPVSDLFTRADSGYWLARAGHIYTHTGPKLWGSIPVELYEGHHPDPHWDPKRNVTEGSSGLGFVELAPGSGSTINRLRNARTVADQSSIHYGPYFEQSGVTPATGKQPSAADVISDLPSSIARGLDWRALAMGGLALYWFFFRK